MENAKPTSTQLPPSIRLSDKDSPSTEEERQLNGKIPYALAVGSIMYAMVASRLDLAHAVGVVSRCMSNPRWKHYETVKHVFRYLKGTKDAQLTFGSVKPTEVKGYTYSDYAKNTDNQKSTSIYIFTYGDDAISWRSKLEECTTLSTTEAEYKAASDAMKEATWLHKMSADFLAKRRIDHPTPTIYCDSQSAIHLIRNPNYHVKMKYIEVRFHHIRELVTKKKREV